MNWFGIGTTLLYIWTVVYFRWESFHTLKTIPLNEFGDFFAGVFGPLMLFWLILGYIQQQKELKQNTAALELQAEELKRSVEQHKELVKTTQQQLQVDKQLIEIEGIRHKKDNEPDLVLTSASWGSKGSGGVSYKFVIINTGKPASCIQFIAEPEIKEINAKPVVNFLGQGERYSLNFNLTNPPQSFQFIIEFKDTNKNEYRKSFLLTLDADTRYTIES